MFIQNRRRSQQKGRISAAPRYLANSHPGMGWHQKGLDCTMSSVDHVLTAPRWHVLSESYLPASSFYGASGRSPAITASQMFRRPDRDQAILEGINA